MSRLAGATSAVALAAGVALTLPAIWWEPLHLDEAITLSYAGRSFGEIVRGVFVERGGAPVHFFVEHATLAWPGGIEGLRLPSVVFFAATVVLAGLLARRLAGAEVGLLVPLLVAVAPLGTGLATFGRMYTLFVATVLATTLLVARAADAGSRRSWVAAGLAAGALVYVHPLAPLYAALAAATGLLASDRDLRRLLRDARPAAAVALVVAAPYAYALAVLRARYDVGFDSSRIGTTAGRSVAEETLHAITPGGATGALLLLALACAGLAAVWARRPRSAVALALWLVVPVAFFSLVPAGTRFFGRYVAPVEPVFYVLVAAGCVAVATVLRRRPVAVLALAAIVGASAWERVDYLRSAEALRLPQLLQTVADDDTVFSSTGTPRADRPAELLDTYVELERPELAQVEELPGIDLRFERGVERRGRANLAAFLRRDVRARGVWIFRGPPHRVERALRRLRAAPWLEGSRPSASLLVVRSRRAAAASGLVAHAVAARQAWTLASPSDRWTSTLLALDRAALAGR